MNNAEVLIKFKGDTSDVDKDTKKLTSSMGGLTKAFTLGSLAAGAVSKGLQMISEYSGRAIQRIDTMNNFPKVMQNFGISADEANKSIQRIDKSVQGLPTSLDQAVAGVQDLFMVTKDLKQSEQLFKAVNDSAMVFANGSTEAVDRFIYGYKQALSAGKVSAQDFNQMNEAIPGLMSKVADSMGVSYKELKEGLSNGSISIDQFNGALKKLDTEGVGSMEALEKSAHTATGGIQTSIENMKTAFTRGVAGIIKSADESLAPLGGLSGIISKIGKVGEQAFKLLGDVLKEVMPMLIEIGKKIMPIIIETFKQLAPVLQKLGEALLPAIKKIIDALLPVLTRVMKKVMPIITNILEQLIPLIDPIADYIVAMIDYTMALTEPMLDIASVILPPLVAILSKLAQVILPLITGWLKILTTVVTGVWNAIKGAIGFVLTLPQIISGLITNTINFIKKLPEYIAYMIGYVVGLLVKFVTQDIPNFIKNIINWFQNLPGNIKTILSNALSAVGNWLSNMYNKCKSAIPNLVNSIVNWFKSLPGKMLSIGKDIVHGIWNGIRNAKDWIIGKIKGFGNSVVKGFKSALKIGSPSKLMAQEIGQWIPKGIAVGIDDNAKSVFKSMQELTNSIGLDPNITSSMQNSFSPNVSVYNNVNVEQDPLGQMVRTIKTYSGGSPNDYNYGAGY